MPRVPNIRWWEGYEPKPKILLNTLQETRSGVAFQEIESLHFGSFEGSSRSFVLSWTLDPLQVRANGSRTFQPVNRCPRLMLPGYGGHGEWRGVARTLILCVFDDLLENTLHRSLPSFAKPQLANGHYCKLQHYLGLVRTDVAAGSPAGAAVVQALAAGVLSVVFPDDDRSRRLEEAKEPIKFATMADYIDANLTQDLRLEDIAAQARVSIRHMSRIFNAMIGIPPHRYVVRRRVEKAIEMIRDDALDLSDVAAAVGFSSHAHMTAAFRQMMNRVPSHFRNTQ